MSVIQIIGTVAFIAIIGLALIAVKDVLSGKKRASERTRAAEASEVKQEQGQTKRRDERFLS
jgi:NADH:ubiquinone oxidoreductase subunit 3 (subunit A)